MHYYPENSYRSIINYFVLRNFKYFNDISQNTQ